MTKACFVTPPASSGTTSALLSFISYFHSPCLASFYWHGFSASYFLTFLLHLTHWIRCLETWCFPWLLWWRLSFYCDFSNHFSGMSFSLISSILGFWGNPFCSHFLPLLCDTTHVQQSLSADSSEILLSLPAFPFRLKCQPVPLIPFQCLADSSAELKLSS